MKTDFRTWLSNQPLAPTSLKVYYNQVQALISRYGAQPTVEQMNSFLSEKSEKRQAHAKYALKYFLRYLGRKKDYEQLVKVKMRKPTRKKFHFKKAEVNEIAGRIRKEDHRAIAYIQYMTGTRAAEVIKIRARDISKDEDEERGMRRLKILVFGKGDKPRHIFIYREDMLEWLLGKTGKRKPAEHIFLQRSFAGLSRKALRPKIETAYKRYQEDFSRAASECGHQSVGTHDLRRSWVDAQEKRNIPGEKSMSAGGWSSQASFDRYRKERVQERDAADVSFTHQISDS
jgi:integrase